MIESQKPSNAAPSPLGLQLSGYGDRESLRGFLGPGLHALFMHPLCRMRSPRWRFNSVNALLPGCDRSVSHSWHTLSVIPDVGLCLSSHPESPSLASFLLSIGGRIVREIPNKMIV